MCGICGIVSYAGHQVDPEILVSMRDIMRHRGPDDYGAVLLGSQSTTFKHIEDLHKDVGELDAEAGLGHRRLSIIDLSENAHQPMCNEDGTVWITYNGEIYNFRELRKELCDRHTFRSKSDTEVVVHGYEEWGEKVVERIDGMFAFAIWDSNRETLFFARDRFGKKPLYYARLNGQFLFASEIKAILCHPTFKRDVDEGALSMYLSFSCVPAPKTLFRDIFKLPAAHRAYLDMHGNLSVERYYDHAALFSRSYTETVEQATIDIFQKLESAIASRMISDVPFGVFLSGGVDSSANVAIMSQLYDRPVETFSVAIKGDRISDEMRYARCVAETFKTQHHEVIIDDQDFLNLFEQLAWYQDEPIADPVCVPLFYVAKQAKDAGVPVIQLGEGSDEIFAGYIHYPHFHRWEKWLRCYAKIPRNIRLFLSNAIIPFLKNIVLKDIITRSSKVRPIINLGTAVAFVDTYKNMLLKQGTASVSMHMSAFDYVSQQREHLNHLNPNCGPLEGFIYQELVQRLPELLLMRLDKMLMANSIEGRAPYLDKDLVECAISLPLNYKIRNGQGKYVLKRALEKLLPSEILYRKKAGFCGSAGNMLSAEIKAYASYLLIDQQILAPWCNTSFIKELFQQHGGGQLGNSFRIWNLFNLALWKKFWF